jgi:4-amino-4-deoxy-L-arabinose transferase-like glycosyltransferase
MMQPDRTNDHASQPGPIPGPGLYIAIWVLLMAVSLFTRPILPVDETRYLAVAWEMWHSNNFLVPHLNGETYSHKPPLLFWAFHIGWNVFGINDWWPRLIAPLFGLGTLYLTVKLALQIWPQRQHISALAPLILIGCLFWALFTTMTMFDMIVAFFSVLGLLGIVIAWRARGAGTSSCKGFMIFAIAIGFGLLAKGPAILLHVLPIALLAPLWGKHLEGLQTDAKPSGLLGWYMRILFAVVLGTLIVLAWAIPAAAAGGEAYANAIFWGQSTGRMVNSFAHGRPWWWYLAVLPPLLLPWFVWPRLWRATQQIGKRCLDDSGIRFCLCWFVPAFVAFSLISGKQLHYLLPEFPALAMMMAFMLTTSTVTKNVTPNVTTNERPDTLQRSLWVPVIFFIFIGALIVFTMPGLLPEKFKTRYPTMTYEWAWLISIVGVIILWLPIKTLRQCIIALTGLSAATAMAVHLIVMPMMMNSFDIRPLARQLGGWERQGIGLAHMNKYHGQYHFAGRLTQLMALVGNSPNQLENWMAKNPNGRVVTYYNPGKIPTAAKPVYVRRFRGTYAVVWDVKTILAHPGIAYRK